MSKSYFTRRSLNSRHFAASDFGFSRPQTAIPVGLLTLSPAFA